MLGHKRRMAGASQLIDAAPAAINNSDSISSRAAADAAGATAEEAERSRPGPPLPPPPPPHRQATYVGRGGEDPPSPGCAAGREERQREGVILSACRYFAPVFPAWCVNSR